MRKLSKAEMTDGFDADIEEQDLGPRRVIQGGKLKFSNDGIWVNSDEEEIPPTLELIVVDRQRTLQKWGKDGAPLESRFLEPNEAWPNIESLNAAAPRSEWREAFGQMQGPWQCSWILYLFDPASGDKYTFVTATTGGHMAVGDLSDKIKMIRQVRGRVHPVVTLASTHMNTKFGGRERPSFKVVRWVRLGGDGILPASPETPSLPAQEGMAVVEEPTVAEIVNDKIRF
jgi:hypothetical protein